MANFVPTMALSALKYRLDDAEHKAAKRAQQAEAASQIEQLRANQQLEETERRERLRRAIAAQRARFGAQGIASSGTAEAVLSGLAKEADVDIATAGELSALRTKRISDEYSRRRSLLEASSPINRLNFGLMQKGLRTIPLIDF
jgi:hypothetical protein